MPRKILFRDIDVRLEPFHDIARHEYWLNADPVIRQSTLVPRWPGYVVHHGERILGVIARREIDYPFSSHEYNDYAWGDPAGLASRSWMLLSADLRFRRYSTSPRAAVERLMLHDELGPADKLRFEGVPSAEAVPTGDDLESLAGLV